MTTAVLSGPAPSAAPDGYYAARFWRSPFAITAAVVVTAQALLISLAGLQGKPFPFEVGFMLTVLGLSFLTAGVWPSWNFMRVGAQGVEQQAGLRSFKADWAQVQNVRVFDGWVELRVIVGARSGEKRVRTARLFNRYALSAEDFGDLIETEWHKARGGRV